MQSLRLTSVALVLSIIAGPALADSAKPTGKNASLLQEGAEYKLSGSGPCCVVVQFQADVAGTGATSSSGR